MVATRSVGRDRDSLTASVRAECRREIITRGGEWTDEKTQWVASHVGDQRAFDLYAGLVAGIGDAWRVVQPEMPDPKPPGQPRKLNAREAAARRLREQLPLDDPWVVRTRALLAQIPDRVRRKALRDVGYDDRKARVRLIAALHRPGENLPNGLAWWPERLPTDRELALISLQVLDVNLWSEQIRDEEHTDKQVIILERKLIALERDRMGRSRGEDPQKTMAKWKPKKP